MRETTIFFAFRLITYVFCLALTISMTINWSLQYSLNKDLSQISFKHYQDTDEDVYPDVSLCFGNAFAKKKLAQFDPPIKEANLVTFLKGEEYEDRFLTINYSDIIGNVDDFAKSYWFRWQNGSTKTYTKESLGESIFYDSFTGVWRNNFFNCFAIHVPEFFLKKEPKVYIEGFAVHLDNSIFPQGAREVGKFATFLHYPNQILLSIPTVKYKFQTRLNDSVYNMKYIVNGMSTLRRRQKSDVPCNENWKKFDNDVIEMNVKKVGCKNIYHKNPTDWPLCNNTTDIRKANFPFRSDIIQKKYDPPCKQVDKMNYVYEETDYPDEPGTFWITILLQDSRYTETIQTRYRYYKLYTKILLLEQNKQ